MFTIIETLYSKTGEVIASGKYSRSNREAAESKIEELRRMNLMFGGREGVTFTVELKAA